MSEIVNKEIIKPSKFLINPEHLKLNDYKNISALITVISAVIKFSKESQEFYLSFFDSDLDIVNLDKLEVTKDKCLDELYFSGQGCKNLIFLMEKILSRRFNYFENYNKLPLTKLVDRF